MISVTDITIEAAVPYPGMQVVDYAKQTEVDAAISGIPLVQVAERSPS